MKDLGQPTGPENWKRDGPQGAVSLNPGGGRKTAVWLMARTAGREAGGGGEHPESGLRLDASEMTVRHPCAHRDSGRPTLGDTGDVCGDELGL